MDENTPTLAELRSSLYIKRAKNSVSGITHGRLWEQTTAIRDIQRSESCEEKWSRNRQHTLRISADFATMLTSKTGPKGRRSSRVPGPTPDKSYVQPGRRASGLPHQLRRHMCLLFAMSNERIQQMLEADMDFKTRKRKIAINVVMPTLSEAVEELHQWLINANPELRFHPALKRRWAPAVCRLMEMHWNLMHRN